MTDETTTTVTEVKPVLMVRDMDKVPGLGMTRMLVPAAEVESYEKAGWIVADE